MHRLAVQRTTPAKRAVKIMSEIVINNAITRLINIASSDDLTALHLALTSHVATCNCFVWILRPRVTVNLPSGPVGLAIS